MPDAIDDPDVLDAINAAKAARSVTPQIDPDVQEAIKAARAAKPYDPNVQPGQYPTSGPLDTISKDYLEGPAQTVAGVVGSAMDVARRPIASFIAGDRRTPEQGGVGRASLAWQSRPELFGGHPELAPTPEETKHALGVKGFADKPGFDAAGNVDWGNVATSKLPNEAQNFAVQMVTDPVQLLLMGTKFGVSPQFAAETAAARDAFRAGTVGNFATTEAAQAATAGKFSSAVEAGQAGAQFHVPLVGKDLGFVQLVPKGAAKWIRALDPAIEFATKTRGLFTGPAPEDPAQLLQTQEEGRSLNTTNELKRQFLPKMAERLTKAGVPLEERPMIRDMAEMLDEDARQIRDETKPADVPDRMAGDFDRLKADDPTIATFTKEKFDQGPAFNKVRRDEVMAHYGTLPVEQQAAIFETAQDMVHLSNAEVKMFRARGMDPNILNAAEMEKFPALLKEHASLTDFINAGKGTPEALAAAAERIKQVKAELPLAAKQYNAVSRYVPLKITNPTRELVDQTVNPNLSKAQAAQAPDKAVRGLTLAEIDPNWKEYGEVKAPSHMAQKYRGVGTPSTAGVGADYVPEGPVKKFFTKLGWKEYKNAESVYEADPLRAWERKLSEADPRAMTNFEMEQHYATRYKQINKRATVQPIRQAAFEGQGLAQLEDIWKQSGRTDTLAEHMDPGVLADVVTGKIKVRDAITQSWTPYGYKEWEAKGFYKPEAEAAPTPPAIPAPTNPEAVPPKVPTPLSDFADSLKNRAPEPIAPKSTKRIETVLSQMGEATGLKPEFAEDIVSPQTGKVVPNARGVSLGQGRVVIKRGNAAQMVNSFGHELIEDIVRDMPLQDQAAILQSLAKGISPEAISKVQDLYSGVSPSTGQSVLLATKELLAEAGGKLFTSPEYLNTFASVVKDPSLLQRVIGRVSKMIDTVRSMLGFEKDPAVVDQLTQTARELIESRRRLIAAKRNVRPSLDNPIGEDRTFGQTVDSKSASENLRNAQNRPPTLASRSEAITPAERAVMDRFPRLVGNAEDLDPKGYLDMPRPEAIKRLAYDYFEDDAAKASTFLDGLEKYKHGDQIYSIEPEGAKEPPKPGPENFMHAGALDELRTYQRLGNDPTGFTNWLRNNAPAYMQAVKLSKAFKTLWGPGAPGYIALKTMHDLVRGQIGDAFDLKSPGEITGNAAGHWKYADSGGMDVSGIGPYDFGKGINPATGRAYGVLSGPEAAAVLERTRAMGHSGEVSAEFQQGGTFASKGLAGKTGNAVTDFAADIPGAGRKIENFIRGQDANFRAAAVAKFMREGLSEGEAAFRMQKAFFDFTRQGPVTRILSQSGAVPFAAWQSKIIPFMARWALERPGEFMFVQKALAAMGAGKIPPSQLPQYIQSGTNLPVNVWKDRDGHTHFGIVTDEGVIPGDELMTIARAGPVDFFMGKSGDILRGLYRLHDRAAQEAKDPEKVTSSEMLGTYAKTVLGHPGHVLSTLNDPEKTAGEKVSAVFNPTQYNTYDATKQGVITTMTARADVKRAIHSVADALLKIRNATADQADKTKTMNQVQALEFLQHDPMYIKAQGELQDSKDRVIREKAYLARVTNEVKRTKKLVEQFSPVP